MKIYKFTPTFFCMLDLKIHAKEWHKCKKGIHAKNAKQGRKCTLHFKINAKNFLKI